MDGRLEATTERFFMSEQKHILITGGAGFVAGMLRQYWGATYRQLAGYRTTFSKMRGSRYQLCHCTWRI